MGGRVQRPIGVSARDWEASRAQATKWDYQIRRLDAQVAWLQVGVVILAVVDIALTVVVIA